MDSERIAALETDIKYLIRAVDNLTNNYVLKAEYATLREEVKELKDKEKHSKANMISGVSAIAAVVSVVVAIWSVNHGH